jgi:hypothetical protein
MENRDSDPLHRKIPVITVCIEDPYYTFWCGSRIKKNDETEQWYVPTNIINFYCDKIYNCHLNKQTGKIQRFYCQVNSTDQNSKKESTYRTWQKEDGRNLCSNPDKSIIFKLGLSLSFRWKCGRFRISGTFRKIKPR